MPRDDPWDRASLDLNVRPNKIVRDISRDDLMIPVGGGTTKLFFMCIACGAMLSVLGLWTLLMLLELAGHGPGRWLLPIVGIAAMVLGFGLFVFSIYDFRRWRAYAERL
jgi:hypothetical protein